MLDGPLWKLPVLLCAPQELFRQSLDSSCVDSVDLLFWHRRREAAPCREGALAGRDKTSFKHLLIRFRLGFKSVNGVAFPVMPAMPAVNLSPELLWVRESEQLHEWKRRCCRTWCAISRRHGLRGLRYGSVINDLLEKEQFVSSHLRSFVMSGAFRHERCRMTMNKMNKEHENAVLCSVPCHATKKNRSSVPNGCGLSHHITAANRSRCAEFSTARHRIWCIGPMLPCNNLFLSLESLELW